MRALSIVSVAVGILTSACPASPPFIECGNDTDCGLAEGGHCLANPATGHKFCAYPDSTCPGGARWSDYDVEDSVSGTCVAAMTDAGVDAMPDSMTSCPTGAPVTNGQAADLVLGQPTFTGDTANGPPFSGGTMSSPKGLFVDSSRLWVTDSGNARVLQWNAPPIVNAQVSDIAIGQASRDVVEPGTTQDRLGRGLGGVFRVGPRLIVADQANNRVLIWNDTPTTSGEPADLVLGQPDFASRGSGNGAANLAGPAGIWSDGMRLVITDTFNNRALIWSTFPTVSNQPADFVIGQAAFGAVATTTPPTAGSLRNPQGVHFDGTRLYIADSGNNRVLVWNSFPTANGTNASEVIGQSNFTTDTKNAGSPVPNAIGFYSPLSLTVDDCGAVYVCDFGNTRVLVYSSAPTAPATPASAVLGAPDFTTQPSAMEPTTATTMDACGWLGTDAGRLYVTDTGNNRVLRYSLSR